MSSIWLLPLVARFTETLEVCIRCIFVFMNVVVVVRLELYVDLSPGSRPRES